VLKRFVDGAEGEAFLPEARARHRAPPGAHGDAVIPFGAHRRKRWSSTDAAGSRDLQPGLHRGCTRIRCAPPTWIIRTSCASDLDPGPGVEWADVRKVATEGAAAAGGVWPRGWPKNERLARMTSMLRIEGRRWTFSEVRPRCALRSRVRGAAACPALATSKMVEGGAPRVFLDYNQNAKESDHVFRVFGSAAA